MGITYLELGTLSIVNKIVKMDDVILSLPWVDFPRTGPGQYHF